MRHDYMSKSTAPQALRNIEPWQYIVFALIFIIIGIAG